MKLTRLRLLGFKSFVEPTDFLIEPGLTGVVGPNGCGKSNLVEALRWVMGETSHKSHARRRHGRRDLRRHRQPAGAQHRRSDADRSTTPTARRRRSSTSTTRSRSRAASSARRARLYRINGREVRARDVQLLFADASTGARSPALVHQGRIGEIIQAKPEQRRRVLEEAAGISGLHARRHEAELRLRAAETNLCALEDVIGQLAAQIDALKRQARQAVRYRKSRPRSARPRRRCSTCAGSRANAEVAEASDAKDLASARVADAHRRAGRGRQAAGECRRRVPPLREAEARAAAALQRLVIARETLDREEARATRAHRRARPAAGAVRRRTSRASSSSPPTPKPRWRGSPQEEERADAGLRAASPSAQPASTRASPKPTPRSAAAEKTFGELTGALADLTARRNQLERARRASRPSALARLEGEIADVEPELAALEAESRRADLARSARAVESRAGGGRRGRGRRASRAEAAHSAARQELDVARGPLAEAERRAQRLETEAKTLRSCCMSRPRICGRR